MFTITATTLVDGSPVNLIHTTVGWRLLDSKVARPSALSKKSAADMVKVAQRSPELGHLSDFQVVALANLPTSSLAN